MFPYEYTLKHINPNEDHDLWALATEFETMKYIAEVVKSEDTHKSYTSPFFYTASLWQPVMNDMINNPDSEIGKCKNEKKTCPCKISGHDYYLKNIINRIGKE